MSCHSQSNPVPAGMGLGGGGGGSDCKGSGVETADGKRGSGHGGGEERKGAWRKGCHICSEEPPNQRAEKISLEERVRQQFILSYHKKIVNVLSRTCPPIAANGTHARRDPLSCAPPKAPGAETRASERTRTHAHTQTHARARTHARTHTHTRQPEACPESCHRRSR